MLYGSMSILDSWVSFQCKKKNFHASNSVKTQSMYVVVVVVVVVPLKFSFHYIHRSRFKSTASLHSGRITCVFSLHQFSVVFIISMPLCNNYLWDRPTIEEFISTVRAMTFSVNERHNESVANAKDTYLLYKLKWH